MNYQFLTYAESKGHNVENLTTDEVTQLKKALLSGINKLKKSTAVHINQI